MRRSKLTVFQNLVIVKIQIITYDNKKDKINCFFFEYLFFNYSISIAYLSCHTPPEFLTFAAIWMIQWKKGPLSRFT